MEPIASSAVALPTQALALIPPPGLRPSPITEAASELIDHLRPPNRLEEVQQVLQDRRLAGSFEAHLEQQLTSSGRIRIGVVDDFQNGNHGKNVEARILAAAPDYLRDRIDVIRYDVGGLSGAQRETVIEAAAIDAQDKFVAALSISGGLEPVPLNSIEARMRAPLDRGTAGVAYSDTGARLGFTAEQSQAWDQLREATRSIPIVTPIWNDGNTTIAALALGSSNGIVTSIDPYHGNHATQSALIDHRTGTTNLNGYASQSAPIFIGQSLGVLSRDEFNALRLPAR